MDEDKKFNKTKSDRRKQFRKVETGNGIDRDLAATTNDRLEMTVLELQNLQENNTEQTNKLGKQLESLDDSIVYLQLDIKTLITTIQTANEKNDRMQVWVFAIGAIGTIFTVLSFIQVIDILVRGIGK